MVIAVMNSSGWAIFFDSHGLAHVSCRASHPHARAFGPLGVSRPLTPQEVDLLGLNSRDTPWYMAIQAGRVVHKNDWCFLRDCSFISEDEIVF